MFTPGGKGSQRQIGFSVRVGLEFVAILVTLLHFHRLEGSSLLTVTN